MRDVTAGGDGPGDALVARAGALVLRPSERRLVLALCAAVSPPGARLRAPADPAALPDAVAALLTAMGPVPAFTVRLFWRVLELWTALTRGTRLSRLPAAEAAAALAAWHDSRFYVRRAAVRSALTVVQLAYWSSPEASGALGWRPGPRAVEPQRPPAARVPGAG